MISIPKEARVKIAGYDPVATREDCHYDPLQAERGVRFMQTYCSHYKGRRFAGKPFLLAQWQLDITRTMLGWIRPDDTRRYRQAYIEVPRKNGKSTFAAALVCYLLFGDGEPGAEIYSSAADKDQASLVYNMVAAMVDQSASLTSVSRVRRSQKMLHYDKHKSYYRAIAHDSAGSHGFDAHAVVADELHSWGPKGEEFLYVLTSSTGSRDQPLVIIITTAGYDRSSVCWMEHERAIAVRDGVMDNAHLLPAIYAADEEDDWTAEETWIKANPNIGVSVSLDYLRAKCKEAQQKPREENRFKQLHLNIWTESAVRFITRDAWVKCGVDSADFPALDGEPCFGGLDLSSTRDLTSFGLVFPRDGEYYIRVWHWIPEAGAREREAKDRVPYMTWAMEGWIELTPGNVVDYNYVRRRINELRDQYDIRAIAFDPYNAQHLISQLEHEDAFDVLKFTQNALNYNSPTKDFEKRVIEGSIHHDRNPVLAWEVSNTEVKTDVNGNIRPVKPKHKEAKRIDGVVASIMGIGAAQQGGEPDNPYNSRGIVVI